MATAQNENLPATIARGAAAGLVGTTVMTAFQRLVEMPLTGRRESYAPADLVTKLLPISPRRKRDRRRLNYAAHFAVGATWGVSHGMIAKGAGLRGQPAVAAVFALLYGGDVVANTALGLYRPLEWSAQDWAVDLVDKLLLAETTGLAYDRLVGQEALPTT
jgi:hypothetical protein